MRILLFFAMGLLSGCGKYQTVSSSTSPTESPIPTPPGVATPSTWTGKTGMSAAALEAQLDGTTWVLPCTYGTVLTERFSGNTLTHTMYRFVNTADCSGGLSVVPTSVTYNVTFGGANSTLTDSYNIDMAASGSTCYQVVKIDATGTFLAIGLNYSPNDCSAPTARPIYYYSDSYARQ